MRRGSPALETTSPVSTFIPSKNDAELVAFVKTGRMMNDPMNKTGIAMPPYGSNPKLTDQEIVDALTYIRSLAVEPQGGHEWKQRGRRGELFVKATFERGASD